MDPNRQVAKGFGLAAPFWFAAASVAVMTAVASRLAERMTVEAFRVARIIDDLLKN